MPSHLIAVSGRAIHSDSKELQKRRAEIGEWKSEDEGNECGKEGDDLQACIVESYMEYWLSTEEYQQPGKASCVSVNWTLGDTQLEAVNTATGRRRDSGTPSRLCKHALFTRWNRLYRKVRASTGQVSDIGQYC
ncbi:Double-stranded RNA-specific editase 1 [Liparis tanakae]|uniref:Double-stranded RNA-specific editase 1 n=1 Tax=Liparis tanakae TaxID=230148 RepID=A0A4Z2HDF1_9TELE|nr:Double-stranded RNA-specific editase 1 [Liparis tanakae]